MIFFHTMASDKLTMTSVERTMTSIKCGMASVEHRMPTSTYRMTYVKCGITSGECGILSFFRGMPSVSLGMRSVERGMLSLFQKSPLASTFQKLRTLEKLDSQIKLSFQPIFQHLLPVGSQNRFRMKLNATHIIRFMCQCHNHSFFVNSCNGQAFRQCRFFGGP
jgi:hypothetical protein